jgi:hypothetical protein
LTPCSLGLLHSRLGASLQLVDIPWQRDKVAFGMYENSTGALQVGQGDIGQRLATIFYKGPDCMLHILCYDYSTLVL